MAKQDLTLKQSKWLKKYLECGSATKAALFAYDVKNSNSASQIGYENLRKLDYTEFLEEAGIAKRQTASVYLQQLEEIGVMRGLKSGRDVYYVNDRFLKILTD